MPHTIIYIAGAGRSGSTMVDIVLGNHPQIVSTGEVSFLINQWTDATRRCGCGRHYAQCPFWGELFPQGADPRLARLVRQVEYLWYLPRLLAGRVPPDVRRPYRAYHERLFDYIVARSGKSMIVDSSKTVPTTVGRFLALARLGGQRVYVVHLVRSGLDTMGSRLASVAGPRGRRVTSGVALRVAVSWVRANLLAAWLGQSIGPGRYLRLRYEDFLSDPATAVEAIGRLVGFDAAALVARVRADGEFTVGHLAQGNRIRMQSRIRIVRHPDRRALDPSARRIFAAVGGWLHLRYGYGWRS